MLKHQGVVKSAIVAGKQATLYASATSLKPSTTHFMLNMFRALHLEHLPVVCYALLSRKRSDCPCKPIPARAGFAIASRNHPRPCFKELRCPYRQLLQVLSSQLQLEGCLAEHTVVSCSRLQAVAPPRILANVNANAKMFLIPFHHI